MQTQTHALIGAYFFGKRWGQRDSTLMVGGAIGGTVPDLPMFGIIAVLAMMGHGGREIFGHDYFQPWWQHINGIAHSLILWPLVLIAAIGAQRGQPTAPWPAILLAVAAAGLAHAIVDFLCHREDAHMQFWPISSWKFVSPISYYEPRHFGVPMMIFEAFGGLLMAWTLGRVAKRRWSRALIVLVSLPYVAALVMLGATTVLGGPDSPERRSATDNHGGGAAS